MKTINTLEDALALELENLYCSEKRLNEQLTKIEKVIYSKELRDIVLRYAESCDNKRLKIDRAFSYIHREPKFCHTNVIDELIQESLDRLKFAQDLEVQELMIVNCIERIINYKVCAYEAALRYAEALNLDVAADLILAIMQWEKKTKKELSDLSLHEFNTHGQFSLN